MNTIELANYVRTLGENARRASRRAATAGTAVKNRALMRAAEILRDQTRLLMAANAEDLEQARTHGADTAFLDRLTLSAQSIESMAAGVEQIATLPDPVGEITDLARRPSGIEVGRMRVPLGVIAIIYEARPNVTADAAALCLKSGNACILRGGSEALRSNRMIGAAMAQAVREAGLPEDVIQVVALTDRAVVDELITLDSHIDIIVPRGGKSLIERVSKSARIPVLKHLHGVCHTFIDASADPEMAIRVADNAKTQRYGTCNTMETLLVHRAIAHRVLPPLTAIYAAKGVELRGDAAVRDLIAGVAPATEVDWATEYLAPILSIRIVDDLDQALEHIDRYGSRHTDAIITNDWNNGQRFLREVDSSSVMVNASTRFADGFEYGLGAEIGISTDKLHARGPVGLVGLTSQKFIVLGQGQIRGG